MSFSIVRPEEFVWQTRPHEAGAPARHVAELGTGNIWRYEPGATGLRHVHRLQEETFVVLAGTLSIYLGHGAERHDVPVGGVVRVSPGTPLQSANHGDDDLLVYAHGYPPEDERAALLDSAV